MLPELGNFALILALCLSVLQCVIPLIGSYRGNFIWMSASRWFALGQSLFVFSSFLILIICFINNDFSVAYVAQNSNSHLPLFYRIGATWGAHEGSLLLWIVVLNIWTLAVCLTSRHISLPMMARVISVLGFISVGFLLFSVATSNPFIRLLPNPPTDGLDLNPILQDPGLMFHPPMLYMGYVGLSVAFAFAIAGLLGGRFDSAWVRWTRPWTLAAWIFLTVGIVLGSWWAYRELGWGGWWFWDPVENASFMPWLVATALIHSLLVSEKRNVLKSWTILLAIFGFSLSLIGTFLVRSGVLSSVHAFATDPRRGLYILGFLIVVIGGSLTLYAWRAGVTKAIGTFGIISRESFLLGNNILLTVAASTVLLGTLYPLILSSLGLGMISVGAPYFNIVFSVLMIPMLFLMALVPFSQWRTTSLLSIVKQTALVFFMSIAVAIVLPLLLAVGFHMGAMFGMMLAFFIIFMTLQDYLAKLKQQKRIGKAILTRSYYGMVLAHIGIAITVLGIVLSNSYSEEQNIRLGTNQIAKVGNYQFALQGVENLQGANYSGYAADVSVFSASGQFITILQPQKRIYNAQNFLKSRSAIAINVWRDVYMSLGESFPDGSWTFRVYIKPFVRWIWAGGFFMMLGGIFAISDRRYRAVKRSQLHHAS